MDLYTRGTNPEFWKEVRQKDCYKNYREELCRLWKTHCEDKPILALTYRDFKLFWTTGDRKTYENAYFSRRLALDSAALLSLIYPEEDKYINRLMDQIYAMCDEYTWALPAHQPVLENNNNSMIDLFAAETGFALAEIYTLLGDRLEPLIKNRIIAEIDRRIIYPFLESNKYSHWELGRTNWTAVCMGSVGCTFMLMRPDLADEKLLERIDGSMNTFLGGFSTEGICYEGCGYWHYGFGFFTVYADMVKKYTNGRVDYFSRTDVRKISTFIQKMFISGMACVSFSDGARTQQYHLGLLHYLKNIYPEDIVVYHPDLSYNYDSCGRFCLHLRSALWLDEKIYYNSENDDVESEYHAHEAQWFIKRNKNYGFAAKGGSNEEPHNQNDVGCFIFAKNGRQLLADLGAGKYTRQYFDPRSRYTILECSSRSHSVPIINGAYQKEGRPFRAKNVHMSDGVFECDIAGAYENIAPLRSLVRRFSFDEKKVYLTDSYEYDAPVCITERFVSLYEPEIDNENAIVRIGDAIIRYNKEICTPIINTEKRIAGDTCYFVDFIIPAGTPSFFLEIE